MEKYNHYQRRFILAMIVYAVLIIASVQVINEITNLPGRILLAVLPIIPIIYGLTMAGRAILSLDEFQQRIHLEALIFSLLGTSLLTFTYGLLQNAGLPQMDVIWVLPIAIFLWGIGQYFAQRKYQ